jgi:hypothetical protein
MMDSAGGMGDGIAGLSRPTCIATAELLFPASPVQEEQQGFRRRPCTAVELILHHTVNPFIPAPTTRTPSATEHSSSPQALVQDYSLVWLDVLIGVCFPAPCSTAAAFPARRDGSCRDSLPGSAAAFPVPGSRLLLALVGAGLPRDRNASPPAPDARRQLLLALIGEWRFETERGGLCGGE